MKFRKRPLIVEAIRYTRDNYDDVATFLKDPKHPKVEWRLDFRPKPEEMPIKFWTNEGQMYAKPGDWIIRGIRGEVYPCKPEIFETTYESVEEAE